MKRNIQTDVEARHDGQDDEGEWVEYEQAPTDRYPLDPDQGRVDGAANGEVSLPRPPTDWTRVLTGSFLCRRTIPS